MLQNLLCRTLDHLLAGSPWAGERLRPHAGACVRIEGGPLRLNLLIAASGSFIPARSQQTPDVTLTLPQDTPLRLLTERDSLFSAVRIAGGADLAEALGFVFRNLRWDAEEDLSHWVGDIAAHRLVRGGQAVGRQLRESVHRVVDNVTEYATLETGMLSRREDIAEFVSEVDRLRDQLARLEKRIERL